MPIYEYVCSACSHRADILHGVGEPGPHFCPECGAEGAMRRAFAPPTIVFKGSGWAKRDRRSGGNRAKTGEGSADGDSSGKAAAGSSDDAGPKSSGTSPESGSSTSSSTGDGD